MRFLTNALIPFVVLFVLAVARRYMPVASVKPPERKYSREELDVRFSSTQWVVGISMVVVGVFFAFATYAALKGVNRYLATADGRSQFLLWPQSAMWWFLPGFGALALSWGITLRLWALFGHREDAELYNYWSSLKSGFDSPKLLRWLTIFVVLPAGVLSILALSMHISLTQNEIRDCGFAFARCKIYRYADARRMTIVDGFRDRDGKLNRRAGIVIDFVDGRRWSSADNSEITERVDPALLEFLKDRIPLPFNYAQTEVDIPRLNTGPGRASP